MVVNQIAPVLQMFAHKQTNAIMSVMDGYGSLTVKEVAELLSKSGYQIEVQNVNNKLKQLASNNLAMKITPPGKVYGGRYTLTEIYYKTKHLIESI